MDTRVDPAEIRLDELVGLLDPAALEPVTGSSTVDPMVRVSGAFAGVAPVGTARLFGGFLAAQALAAAARTVPAARPVHSMHGYFTRMGDARSPLTYRVENLRDGQNISTRRSIAIQRGAPIFHLTASFHEPGSGLDHHPPAPAATSATAATAAPEQLPTLAQRLAAAPGRRQILARAARPFDVRYLDARAAWVRTAGRLPDDPLVHACVLAYISDLGLLDTVLVPHTSEWGEGDFIGASIDHSVWFHRPCRVDEWLLWECDSPWAASGRGMATGRVFTAAGDLVATVAQEGLLRPLF